MAEVSLPGWVQTAIALGTPLTGVMLYIFGRGSATGIQSHKIEAMQKRQETMEGTLAANVTAVSNHAALLALLTAGNQTQDAKLDEIGKGIATLMERTKHL